jgi:osmotically-inducible protein OsmY
MSYRVNDRAIVMDVRREIVRRQSVDCSTLNVHCINGVVELSGTLRVAAAAGRGISGKDELEQIKEIIMRLPGVKDIIDRYLRIL